MDKLRILKIYRCWECPMMLGLANGIYVCVDIKKGLEHNTFLDPIPDFCPLEESEKQESKGVFGKFIIQKSDGSDIDPKADYFVLRADTDEHARKALMAYARSVSEENKELADELLEWVESYETRGVLSIQKKIELLNTLHHKVYDHSVSGGEVEYIAVPLDEEVVRVLKALGKDDKWIEEQSDGEDNISLADIGFELANWWSSKDGFSLKR